MKDIINGLVSQHVLNWSKKILINNDQNLPFYAEYWIDESGKKMEQAAFWNPYGNLEHAYTLLEMLREKGLIINVETLPDKYKSTYNGEFATYSNSVSKAICIAALKWCGVELSEEYLKN